MFTVTLIESASRPFFAQPDSTTGERRSVHRDLSPPPRRWSRAQSAPGPPPVDGPMPSVHLPLMLMRFTLSRACRDFGSLTVRMPFLNDALTLSSSTSAGSAIRRSKRP